MNVNEHKASIAVQSANATIAILTNSLAEAYAKVDELSAEVAKLKEESNAKKNCE